jgi:hypothetical protein
VPKLERAVIGRICRVGELWMYIYGQRVMGNGR